MSVETGLPGLLARPLAGAEPQPRPAGRWAGRARTAASGLKGFILPALLLAAWEGASRAGFFAPHLMPAPSAVLRTVVELWQSGELIGHITVTLERVLFGFVTGTLAATVLGAVTGYSRLWRELLDPLLQALRNIPSIAWVPLFILWLGIFETSKIALIAAGVFFPVYLGVMGAILSVDRKIVEIGRTFRQARDDPPHPAARHRRPRSRKLGHGDARQ